MNSESNTISFEEFKKVEMKIGTILSAEKIPDTDKLLKLSVDLGEGVLRQIVSGIAEYFPEPGELIGMQCVCVSNLAGRTIRGCESNGMILAVTGGDGTFSLLSPQRSVPSGSRVT